MEDDNITAIGHSALPNHGMNNITVPEEDFKILKQLMQEDKVKDIPHVFIREPDTEYLTPEVNPECQWVLDGEGIATTDGEQMVIFPKEKMSIQYDLGLKDSVDVRLGFKDITGSKCDPRTFKSIRINIMSPGTQIERIIYRHFDGRMAQVQRGDFPPPELNKTRTTIALIVATILLLTVFFYG